jgi:hypothetical protein
MRLAVVAAMVASLLLVSRPAEAATPIPSAAAYTTVGMERLVTWVDGGTLYLQRLKADGSPNGFALRIAQERHDAEFDQTFGADVGIVANTKGTVLIVPVDELQQGVQHNDGPRFYFLTPDDQVVYAGYPLCDAGSDSPVPIRGVAAWSGSRAFVAANCDPNSVQWSIINAAGQIQVQAPKVSGQFGELAAGAAGSYFGLAFHRVGSTGNLDVKALRVRVADGTQFGPLLDVASGLGDQQTPTIAGSGTQFLIAWIDGSGRDIHGRTLGSMGLGVKRTLVNASGNQNHPWLAASSNGGWHLAWADLRSGSNDIYAAHVSSAIAVTPADGQLVAGGAGSQRAPTVSTRSNGAGSVAFLDQDARYFRDLTATSAPTGTATRLQYNAPK